jgi:hypothetical protein
MLAPALAYAADDGPIVDGEARLLSLLLDRTRFRGAERGGWAQLRGRGKREVAPVIGVSTVSARGSAKPSLHQRADADGRAPSAPGRQRQRVARALMWPPWRCASAFSRGRNEIGTAQSSDPDAGSMPALADILAAWDARRTESVRDAASWARSRPPARDRWGREVQRDGVRIFAPTSRAVSLKRCV